MDGTFYFCCEHCGKDDDECQQRPNRHGCACDKPSCTTGSRVSVEPDDMKMMSTGQAFGEDADEWNHGGTA